MVRESHVFTSESVSEGHPDKVCDRISDTVVDIYLEADPASRVACETLATTNRVVLAGEVRGPASVTREVITDAVRSVIRDIGYEQDGFHWRACEVEILLHAQSPDIAIGVDALGNKEEGAGDQGVDVRLCLPRNRCIDAGADPLFARHSPEYGRGPTRRNNQRARAGLQEPVEHTIREWPPGAGYLSGHFHQHSADLDTADVREIVRPFVEETLPENWMCPESEFYVNPTGRFVIGGPDGDAGLTGRKIIVDTYGGAAPHGGGAFSGKDPTKVDRSAAYAARWVAKNIVAAELADRCTIQVSYAIGVSKPLSVYVNTHGTGRIPESRLEAYLKEMIDLSPRAIRERLGLSRPIYARTAAYGHFGRQPEDDGGFSWERLDLVEALASLGR